MAVNTSVLAKVLDHAITHDMESAIAAEGESLSDDEKSHLMSLNKGQMIDILRNLEAADQQLNRMLFFDDNVNNNH